MHLAFFFRFRALASALLLAATLLLSDSHSAFAHSLGNCIQGQFKNGLEWLEADSPERSDWIQQQNAKVFAELRNSPNREAISNWFRDLEAVRPEDSDTLSVRHRDGVIHTTKKFEFDLAPNSQLIVTDARLQGPEKIELIEDNVIETLLEFKRNPLEKTVDVVLSPNQDFALVTFSTDGSIDHFEHLVVDLKSKTVIPHRYASSSKKPIWVDSHEFLVQESNSEARKYEIVSYRLSPSGELLESRKRDGELGLRQKDWAVEEIGKSFNIISSNGSIPVPVEPKELLDSPGKLLYYVTDQGIQRVQKTRLFALMLGADTVIKKTALRRDTWSSTRRIGNHFFITTQNGFDQAFHVFTIDGHPLSRTSFPSSLRITGASWKTPGRELRIEFTSDVNTVEVEYDIERGVFSPPDFEQKAMMNFGKSFASKNLTVKSSDGKPIPVRLIHLANLKPNADTPVLIDVYGGHGKPSLYAKFEEAEAMFMLHGGMIVRPGVRGGNEYGEEWHKSGKHALKENTLNDVVAVAEYLAAKGLSSAKKIVAMGSSHGGFVVAGAALQRPEAFGLIIPRVGLLNLLRKDVLDQDMNYGFIHEFEDSRAPSQRERLRELSPVEMAKKGKAPEVLIITGLKDSRVNPAHSFQLAKALQDNPATKDTTRILTMKNAGHFVYSTDAGLQGWKTQEVIWTKIYDFFGLKFDPSKMPVGP